METTNRQIAIVHKDPDTLQNISKDFRELGIPGSRIDLIRHEIELGSLDAPELVARYFAIILGLHSPDTRVLLTVAKATDEAAGSMKLPPITWVYFPYKKGLDKSDLVLPENSIWISDISTLVGAMLEAHLI